MIHIHLHKLWSLWNIQLISIKIFVVRFKFIYFLVYWHKKLTYVFHMLMSLQQQFSSEHSPAGVTSIYGIGDYESCDVVPCWSTEGCNYGLGLTRYILQANYVMKHHVINNFTCLQQLKCKRDVFVSKGALNLVASLCNVMNNLLVTYGVSNLYRSFVKAIL